MRDSVVFERKKVDYGKGTSATPYKNSPIETAGILQHGNYVFIKIFIALKEKTRENVL